MCCSVVYLGTMCGRDRCLIQDNVYAHMWFNIAAADGDKTALKARDQVAKEMSSEDISEAQDMAREWVKNHP